MDIWGTGEHKILCANDIKYCYKKPFFLEETQNGMVLVTLVLVWCVSGCFNGTNFKIQIRKAFALSICHLGTCVCFSIILMFRSGISVSFW